MTVDVKLITRKFLSLKKYLSALDQVLAHPLSDLEEQIGLQLQAERIFEIIAQAMVDICTHIIVNLSDRVPESYSECMKSLGKGGVISNELAVKLAEMAKMRNLIVHRYEVIDYRLLYEALKEIRKDVESFRQTIFRWLERKE